jgi:hypothetical protein
MIGVVFDCVARHCMNKNCEPAPIHNEPGDNLGKLVGVKRDPATCAQVRTDGLVVQWSDRKAKSLADFLGELSSFLAARRVEVYVDVITCDCGHLPLLG